MFANFLKMCHYQLPIILSSPAECIIPLYAYLKCDMLPSAAGAGLAPSQHAYVFTFAAGIALAS